jgi:hypothetical protein
MQIFKPELCLKSGFRLFIYVNPSSLTKCALILYPKLKLFGIIEKLVSIASPAE